MGTEGKTKTKKGNVTTYTPKTYESKMEIVDGVIVVTATRPKKKMGPPKPKKGKK